MNEADDEFTTIDLISAPPPDWDALTEEKALRAVFEKRFAAGLGHGIDRITPAAFGARLAQEVHALERNARTATHRFTPYRERLVLKGRGKAPRMLSIPSVRDKLVLHQLKEYVHATIPGATERTLPNQHIRDLKTVLQGKDVSAHVVIRADIASFYDRIPHSTLLSQLVHQIPDPRVLTLLRRAVRTPTVPAATRRPRRGWGRAQVGVPQGLAISNALANLYLESMDTELRAMAVLYLRYVDDILIIVETGKEKHAEERLQTALSEKGLELNKEKTHTSPLDHPFEYLGYRITWPVTSVRRATTERFLRDVAGMVTAHRERTLANRFPAYLNGDDRKSAFVAELNEKITGAISEVKRYGWLFYFSEITDLDLLFSMDKIISGFFARLADFGGIAPPTLKRLSRAYFEARHSPDRGYIHNYNALSTVAERLAFLIRRGRIDPSLVDRLPKEDIEREYARYKSGRLQRLEQDVGHIY